MNPKDLPIYEIAPALKRALDASNRLVVRAPTGSGKSTQVPQLLADHPGMAGREIIVLQPRRLPARMLAKRVAEERGVELGQEVGYQVRFDSRRTSRTRICFITEAILLRRMMDDPELKGVGAVVFDEFHERHLYADVSLVCCRKLQEATRPDLRLVVMSATLQTEALQSYLQSCVLLESEGRTFPVTEEYLDEEDTIPVWEAAALELGRAVRKGCEGDALIFMPGAYEINRTIQEVRMLQENKNWVVLPLHGELPPQQQDAAMEQVAGRKVIVSTNVAETSLTIDGIRLVIDSGLARVARFDPHRGINTLVIDKISRASAEQRKGRAGRTAPGHCMRLWTENDHRHRAAAEAPEIKRVDLAEICLTLLGAGHDPANFPWFEAPLENSLRRALVLLADLGAMKDGGITDLGRRMLAFPVHPRFSRLLIEAGSRGCVRPAALIAALCQGRSILQRADSSQVKDRRDDVLGGEGRSDFFQQMRAFQFAARGQFRVEECRKLGIHAQSASQAGQLQERFLEIAEKQGIPLEDKAADEGDIRRCVLAAFSDQVAKMVDPGMLRCELVHGRRGTVARSSVVRQATLLVASEISEIEGRDKEMNVILNQVTEIEEEWLRELQPEAFTDRHEVRWDPVSRKVLAERLVIFRDLVLRREALAVPPPEQAAVLLAKAVREGKCPLTHWDDAVESWIVRLNCLAAWCPEYELPPILPDDRLALLEQICLGGYTYKEIKDRAVAPVVHAWLSSAQRSLLDRMAPDRFELPGGRQARLVYKEGKEPVLAAKIQDLFGLLEAPKVAGGKVEVTIEVLAPNMRAVQMTRDLKNFWKETYPQIKPELARRYPKHRWI